MRFIKLFVGNHVPTLEKKVNEWIVQHKPDVVDVRFSSSQQGCVCVIYEADAPIE